MAMQFYTEFTHKTPKELLLEAEADIKQGLLPRERRIKTHFRRFREYLEDRDKAPNTTKGRLVGVQSFYRWHDIDIPKVPKSDRSVQSLEEHREIPTKEDIREVLKHCNPLEKAILLVGIASGLAVTEITKLRVGDFYKGYDKETGITTLKLRRQKNNRDFVTFLTPEASTAVLDYLKFRGRQAKTLQQKRSRQLEKQRVRSDKGYLFICQKVPDEFLKTKKEELRKLDEKTVMSMYRKLSEDSQKCAESGIWNIVRSHNIRKFFNSTLKNAGADNFFVEQCMGHVLDSTQTPYFNPDPVGLKEIYKKYAPLLIIQKELVFDDSPAYKQIKEQNETLIIEAEKYKLEREELLKIKAQLEKMKEFEELFKTEINRLKDRFENPVTEADKMYNEHRVQMANNPEYKRRMRASFDHQRTE